jgi:hypothetical protein
LKVSVREATDGVVWLKCFSCLDTPAILAACGLTLADLFPRRSSDRGPVPPRDRWSVVEWRAAIEMISFESRVVLIAAADMLHGQTLSVDDFARVKLATDRMDDARIAFGVSKFRPEARL